MIYSSLAPIPSLVVSLALCTTLVSGQLKPPEPYFPVKLGTTWIYEVTGDKSEVITEKIASAEKKDGVWTVTLNVTYEEVVKGVKMTENASRKVTVSDKGVFALSPWPEKAAESTLCLLQLPPQVDLKWREKHPEENLTRSCKVVKSERLKLDAGTFQTVQVETTYTTADNKDHTFSTDWYAPGVGLVKQERRDLNRVQVLKSFTIGTD